MRLSDFRRASEFAELTTTATNLTKLSQEFLTEYKELRKYALALENEINSFGGVIDDGMASMELMPKPDKMKQIMFLQSAANKGFDLWQDDNPNIKPKDDFENCFSYCVESINFYAKLATFAAIVGTAYRLTKDNDKANEIINSLASGLVPTEIAEMLDEYVNGTDFDQDPH